MAAQLIMASSAFRQLLSKQARQNCSLQWALQAQLQAPRRLSRWAMT